MTTTERVWSVNPFANAGMSRRGNNVTTRAAAVLDTDVEGPDYGGIHHVTAGKRRAAKQPFSRLSAPREEREEMARRIAAAKSA